MRHRLPRLATLLLCLSAGGTASAHTITVDGLDDDWLTRAPNAADLGMIVRNSAGHGELVWRDAVSDARTLVSNPENEADMSELRVTGDASNLYFLVRLPNTHSATPAQVQIAIDLAAGGLSTFLSGAETSLAVGTAADFVVRTTFTSPFVANASAQVSNAAQTVLASVPTTFGADGVEIAVPWTLFGLNGPPAGAVKLSVAVFRAANALTTVEVTGPDALDVLTDYGDPRGAVASPGTGTEFSGDSRVDDFIECYFSATGEVYSPIVVSRLVPNGNVARNWVVLKNVSGTDISRGGLKIGDSELPDDGEGMGVLPAGTLAAGAEFVVATHGTEYQTYFGVAPGAEAVGNSATVPDLTPFAPWSATAMTLATAGDEILLLDATNTLLDVVTWGTGSYAGITALTPTPTANTVIGRDPSLTDTDDCAEDFSSFGAQCASSATCGACKVCAQQVCGNAGSGTSCTDGDVCNGVETCNGSGACVAGQAPDCSDQNPCTTDSCHPLNGCVHGAAPAGTACNDGEACTTGDGCDGASSCTGSPVDCTPPPPQCSGDTSLSYQSNGCNAGSCDFLELKTSCKNGCDAKSGLCAGDPCAGLDCTQPPSQCHYFSGGCKQGLCDYDAKAPGTPCDDKDPCTVLDGCTVGQTCAGVPVQCNAPPPASCVTGSVSRQYDAVGQCSAGSCDYDFTDTDCPSGCNDRTGLCNDDPCALVTCNAPPGDCYVDVGSCSNGTCSYELRPMLSVCDDGDACTSGDACDAKGVCAGTDVELCADPCADVACDDPPSDCHEATGRCSQGTCSYEPKSLLTPCDDGDDCTTDDACDAQGACDGTPLQECGVAGNGGGAGRGGGGGAGGAGGMNVSGGTAGASSGGDAGADTGDAGADPGTGGSMSSGGTGGTMDPGDAGEPSEAGAPSGNGGRGGRNGSGGTSSAGRGGRGGASSGGTGGSSEEAGTAGETTAPITRDPGGCACSTAGDARGSSYGSLSLLGLLGALARLRRRRDAA